MDRIPLAPAGVLGAAGPGVVLIRRGAPDQERILRHEFWHFRQMAWFSPLGFAVIYFGEFLIRILVYRQVYRAYSEIFWERQAREKMDQPKKLRPHWVLGKN